MGIQGRDYMQDRSVFGGDEPSYGARPVWTWCLVASIGVLWILFASAYPGRGSPNALGRAIHADLLLHPLRAALWQPFTCVWFHSPSGITHVGWNAALLFLFGRSVERRFGWRTLATVAGLGGIAGSLAVLAGGALGLPVPPLVLGASGMVVALGPLAARASGSAALQLGRTAVPARVLVGVAVIATVLVHPRIVTGEGLLVSMLVAHGAALAVGLLGDRLFGRPGPRAVPAPDVDEDPRGRIDVLLARISADGLDSLSPAERAFLDEASKRLRQSGAAEVRSPDEQ